MCRDGEMERRDGIQPNGAVRARPQEMLRRKTLSTTRGDLIFEPLREARLGRAGSLTPGI